jgi:hypothetical protein
MSYLAIVFLLAAGVAIVVALGSTRRHRREVIGSTLNYQTDKNWYITPM